VLALRHEDAAQFVEAHLRGMAYLEMSSLSLMQP
jgi:hypothetical protein